MSLLWRLITDKLGWLMGFFLFYLPCVFVLRQWTKVLAAVSRVNSLTRSLAFSLSLSLPKRAWAWRHLPLPSSLGSLTSWPARCPLLPPRPQTLQNRLISSRQRRSADCRSRAAASGLLMKRERRRWLHPQWACAGWRSITKMAAQPFEIVWFLYVYN